MARNETTATSTVNVNGEQAKQELTLLAKRAETLKQKLKEANDAGDGKAFDKLSKQLKSTQKEMKQLEKDSFDLKRVLNNLSGASIGDLTKAKRELDKQFNSPALQRNSKEWKQVRDDLRAVKREMSTINNEAKVGESGLSKFANGFNKYFAAVTAVIAGITGLTLGLKKFIEMRNEVEDSAANLQSLTGLGDQDIAWLRQYAKELSTTTTEAGVRITASAKEIMDGFTTIGSKRPELLKNKEAMAAVTKEALTLAAAGKMDVATAFDVVTASMNQFNLGAAESGRIINVIAAGSLEGSAEADSLAGSLKNVGTVADGSNMTLEDTIALLEVLASKQLMGEEAGTKLRGAILRMKDAGVGYVSGAFNMRDAIIEVNKQLDKKTSAAEKDALMQKIFGAENITVGQILVKNVEAYDKLKVAVTGTNTAYKQAEIQTDTVSAKMAQAKNRFSEAGMELVKNFNPAILSATNFTTQFLKFLVQLPKWLSENKGLLLTLAVASATYAVAVNRARIASLAWYTTEKLKVGLASISKVLDFAHIAALRVRIALTGQATFAELRLVAAQKAMNATMMLNMYVAVVAAIAAIGYGVYKLSTRTTEAQKAMKEFNQEAATQQRELNNIFEAYKKANPKTEEKARLLAIIKEKYGPYIKDLINEKGEITNIEKAQLQANKALAQSIALKTKNKYIDENAAKEIEYQADKMTKLRDELISDKGSSLADVLVGEVGAIFQKNINDPLKAGTKEAFALLDKHKLMSGPLDRKNYGEIINGIASSFYRMNMKSKEFDAIFKGLIGDFKVVNELVSTTPTTTDTPTTPSTTITGDTDKSSKKALEDPEWQFKLNDQAIDKWIKKMEDYEKALSDLQNINIGIDEEIDDTEIVKYAKFREDFKLDELVKFKSQKELELALVKEYLDKELLTEKEAARVRQLLRSEEFEFKTKDAKAAAQEIANITSNLSSVIEGFQNAELSLVESRYDKEIAAARKAGTDTTALEEKKNEEMAAIRAKNADKIFALQVAGIIASTAASAIDAYASALKIPGAGLVLAPIAAGAAVAFGAAQIAQANAAREAAKESYAEGGFTRPGGKYEPAGVVHAGEFVANQEAVGNNTLRRLFNVVDYAQKTNTVARIDNDAIARALSIGQGYSGGGFVAPAGTGAGSDYNTMNMAAMMDVMRQTNAVNAALLAEIQRGIVSKTYIHGDGGIEKAQETYNKIIKNAKG